MPKKTHYQHLRDKWLKRHRDLQEKLHDTHAKTMQWLSDNSKQALLGGIMLASGPLTVSLPIANSSAVEKPVLTPAQKKTQMLLAFKQTLPSDVRSLTKEEENALEKILSENYNLPAKAEVDGKRLNRTYGIIGKEQHLFRYPGDTIDQHFDNPADTNLYFSDGIAPGLGAWGYFARSKDSFTEKDKLREKYYIAVQTFLAPGFNEHVGEYGLFFKYRKMLVVNPENGKAVVADIADAGPAEWTGKSLGGSPEVMHYLERVDGAGKGPVLYFFIDDPHDTIPLGPRELL